MPKLQAPRRGVAVVGPDGRRWESAQQLADVLDCARSAIYRHGAWERDHWQLVAYPVSRRSNGVIVAPRYLEQTCDWPYSEGTQPHRRGANQQQPHGNERRGMEHDYTVAEVAQLLRVSPETVRNWLTSGDLEGYQLPGGIWRIPRESVEALKRRRRVQG